MVRWNDRRQGIALVAASAVLWSLAGLFVRWAALDTWTMVAWRALFAFITLSIIALARQRGHLLSDLASFGLPESVAIAMTIISGTTYIFALQLTSVATVTTIYATLPFITTGIAFLWLGERATKRFFVAGGLALAAIVAMAGAVATRRDLGGIVAALVMTAGYAVQLVHAKRHPGLNMTLLVAVAAATTVVIAAPFMRGGVPAPRQLLACALYGGLTTGFAYILVLKGGQLISSGEAALISTLDLVLAPLWVWLVFAEEPTGVVLACSLVVLSAVLWYIVTSRQDGSAIARAEPALPSSPH